MYFKRIKELRIDNDLTQAQLGYILGIKYNSYGQIENGVNDLHASDLIKLCKFYKVSADYILGLTDKKQDGR